MPTAYILLNTEIGAEAQVLKAIKKIEGVVDAHKLWGVYEIIARVEANSMDKLKFIINNYIEKIGKINSKLTMISIDHPQSAIHKQELFEKASVIM